MMGTVGYFVIYGHDIMSLFHAPQYKAVVLLREVSYRNYVGGIAERQKVFDQNEESQVSS